MLTDRDGQPGIAGILGRLEALEAMVETLERSARPVMIHAAVRLTPIQAETVRAIRDFWAVNGFGPSHAELAGMWGITENGARGRVMRMARQGLVTFERYQSRSLRALVDPDGQEPPA